ncbi:MAG: DUF305 domain-containing protein [Gemmatimonadales bacterium]
MFQFVRHGAAAAALAVIASAPVAAQAPHDYVQADVDFMQGMIWHHAQAVSMCLLAGSHGASEKVAELCHKIILSQEDEIGLMQNWLADRGRNVPHPRTDTMVFHEPASASAMPAMAGMAAGESHMMPGMLNHAQMLALDSARGTAWDRAFLVGMMQHHGGAITMVTKLFDTGGAGQQAELFRFATGVDADQRGEINRMQIMLNSLPGGE